MRSSRFERSEGDGRPFSLGILLQALRLVWSSAPGWTSANLVLVFLQGVLPLAALYLMKRIIDAVTAALGTSAPIAGFEKVLPWILAAAAVAIFAAITRAVGELATEAQGLAVTDEVADVLHAKAVSVDLEHYENPGYHDLFHRAQHESPYRPRRIVSGLIGLGQNTIAILAVGGLLVSFDWRIGFVLIALALPAAWLRLRHSRRLYALEVARTEQERRSWYFHWLLTHSAYAKEVRLFGLGPLFRDRFRVIRSELRSLRLDLARRRAVAESAGQALASFAVFATFALLAWRTLQGEISLGSLVVYYQGFHAVVTSVQNALRSATGLYEDSLFLRSFEQFLALPSRLDGSSTRGPVPREAGEGIAFEGVRFAYPGSTREALCGVDLQIRPGEIVALVGENGSGKTTLIRLLGRLHDPTAGRITVEGVDLREIDPTLWHGELAVLLQDYARYFLTARENIGFGDVDRNVTDEEIAHAARLAGADEFLSNLPQGYDTTLGGWFTDGQELSTGEWQRLALSRALLRPGRLLVLDEPTSSLDPRAEAELFRGFRERIGRRSALVISHRLTTARMADRICVLDRGRVVESGSHAELMALGGTYAGFHAAQAATGDPRREDAPAL